MAVEFERRNGSGGIDEFHAFPGCVAPKGREYFVRQLEENHGFGAERHFSGIHFRKVEDVVHELEKGLAAVAYEFQRVFTLRFCFRAFL